MKKYLLVLLGLFILTTTTYSQELTEKEKARQEKEARKQAKENAKKEAKLKKAAKKDAKIADLRADYEEFLAEWETPRAAASVRFRVAILYTFSASFLAMGSFVFLFLAFQIVSVTPISSSK